MAGVRNERFDAIIIGAGPAGSVTAYRLARAGATVLLVDRSRFPRIKPCGGALTPRALRQLPLPIDPVVEQVVSHFEFRFRHGRKIERQGALPVMMTQRKILDTYLAERATKVGAEFRDGVTVQNIEVSDGGAVVTIDDRHARAAILIGADGANGVTARAAGLAGGREHAVALECDVEYDYVGRGYRGRAVGEFGNVRGGYGWVFPKSDHVNVGIAGWQYEGPNLRTQLQLLLARHGIPRDAVKAVRGHRLPMRRADAPLARGKVALVGDAAGLVDPLSGEGIYGALLSAKLAASAAIAVLDGHADNLDSYHHLASRAFNLAAPFSWNVRASLDRFPRLAFSIAVSPPVWHIIDLILQGETAAPTFGRGRARAGIRILHGLARMCGDPGRPFQQVDADELRPPAPEPDGQSAVNADKIGADFQIAPCSKGRKGSDLVEMKRRLKA